MGDLTRAEDVARALAGCRRLYFGMSLSASYLEATVIAVAAAREHGDLEVFVNISQMTVSQMSLYEMTDCSSRTAYPRKIHNTGQGRKKMKILMVLTSHDQLGNTGHKTGFWLEEFAAPYFAFRDAGVELTIASPKGGQPPVDPKSDLPENQTPAMARFKQDQAAQEVLARSLKLRDMQAEDYDTIFYVGGHGPMWDLAEDPDSIALIEAFYNSGKPVAAVCHSPGVLHRVTYKGEPIVKGKRVTGFSNSEEEAVHLTNVVPFLVEDELKRLGGLYEKAPDWQSRVVVDGRLITGQNPASSFDAAQALLKLMARKAVA